MAGPRHKRFRVLREAGVGLGGAGWGGRVRGLVLASGLERWSPACCEEPGSPYPHSGRKPSFKAGLVTDLIKCRLSPMPVYPLFLCLLSQFEYKLDREFLKGCKLSVTDDKDMVLALRNSLIESDVSIPSLP